MNKTLKVNFHAIILIILISVSFFSTSLVALSTEWASSEKSKVRLISSKTNSDNSNELVLGLEYQLEPGWKTYWKSPGGGGFPQNIVWKNSKNINDLQIDWPIPKKFEILGLSSVGYEEKVIFPIKLTLEDTKNNTILDINVNYLVCKDICIPGNANLYLEIPPGKGEYTSYFHDIEKVRSSLPTSAIKLNNLSTFKVNAEETLNEVIINVKIITNSFFNNPQIYIHTPFGLPVIDPVINYSLDYKEIKSNFKYDIKQFDKKQFPIEIILSDSNHSYIHKEIIDIKKIENLNYINNNLVFIILTALVGGLILNLMPCVFPVISIKLLSVLNTETKNIRKSFVVTAIGIISSFIILGVFFSILKQLNTSISWGMQFQEPYFLITISIIILFFLLNTLGLFEINLPKAILSSKIFILGNNFYTKNFFNGFFATLLATPCSAPFIGTAVTFAFTQSIIDLLLIFMFMGIGMSLPYLLVITFPKLVLSLPKPGPWTNYVKYFLALLLFITILWLLNILMAYYNLFYIITFMLVFVFIAFFLFKNFYPVISSSILIIFLFTLPSLDITQKNRLLYDDKKWLDFNSTNIDELINDDKIIFLDVTADWCITCQFNKANVINTKDIKKLFNDNNIILIKADWTKPNKKIANFLSKNNKFGIPFNIFYSKKFPQGIILSEILTAKDIKETLKQIQ